MFFTSPGNIPTCTFLWVFYIFLQSRFLRYPCSRLFPFIVKQISFLFSVICLLRGSSQDLSFFLGHAQIFAYFSLLVYFCVFPSFNICVFSCKVLLCFCVFSFVCCRSLCYTGPPSGSDRMITSHAPAMILFDDRYTPFVWWWIQRQFGIARRNR